MLQPIIENQLTLGERTADKIAGFGGSWTFIIYFFVVLAGWIIMKVKVVRK